MCKILSNVAYLVFMLVSHSLEKLLFTPYKRNNSKNGMRFKKRGKHLNYFSKGFLHTACDSKYKPFSYIMNLYKKIIVFFFITKIYK